MLIENQSCLICISLHFRERETQEEKKRSLLRGIIAACFHLKEERMQKKKTWPVISREPHKKHTQIPCVYIYLIVLTSFAH